MERVKHIGESFATVSNSPDRYTVLTEGVNAGLSTIDLPHYASNSITFNAKKKMILDWNKGLENINTGDVITVRGSEKNDGVYSVTKGGDASHVKVDADLTDELAGCFITISKRATPTNAVVVDSRAGLTWHRTPSHLEKIGPNSDGQLYWYSPESCYALHCEESVDGMEIMAGNVLRIINGASEASRFYPGMIIQCAGFENASNNLPGYCIDDVGVVDEKDLHLILWAGDGESPLVNEIAPGPSSIKVICDSIFAYAAAANAVALGGFSDWRIPTDFELRGLCAVGKYPAVPDDKAFPEWTTRDWFWSAVTNPANAAFAMIVYFHSGVIVNYPKSSLYYCSLVRG